MIKGDTSIFTDAGGVEHVAVVTEAHTDGTVDLAVLKTSQRNVERSAQPAPGKFFDPDWAPMLTGNEPRGEHPVIGSDVVVTPAHGAPALTSVPEDSGMSESDVESANAEEPPVA